MNTNMAHKIVEASTSRAGRSRKQMNEAAVALKCSKKLRIRLSSNLKTAALTFFGGIIEKADKSNPALSIVSFSLGFCESWGPTDIKRLFPQSLSHS